jgi:hypothetical protein
MNDFLECYSQWIITLSGIVLPFSGNEVAIPFLILIPIRHRAAPTTLPLTVCQLHGLVTSIFSASMPLPAYFKFWITGTRV